MRSFLVRALILASWPMVSGISAAQASPAGTYKVHNIDVGQGTAVLVQTLGGRNILMDTGWDFAGDRLVAYLKKIKVKKIDALVVSHRHMDHIGGVQKLSEALPVDKVIGPWAKEGIPVSAMVHLGQLRKSIGRSPGPGNRPEYETATMGKVFDFGKGFSMECLWPKVHSSGKRIGDYNEESVVMRVSQKSPGGKAATFMFGGDLGVKEERWLARSHPQKMKVDWVVADHHGSAGSSQREYMVALDGGYSRMLKALIEGPGGKDGRVFQVANKLKNMGRGRLAGLVMRQLDPLNTNPKPIRAPWLREFIGAVKEMDASQPHMKGRFAVYSVGPNAYGHPNATRMSEAMLAGFTPITTWANGSVVMTRELGRDGNWADVWKPVANSSRDLPRVKVPGWLGHRDPERPYNDVRREANGHWQKQNPHTEVSWTAAWDTSKTWRQTSRELAKGRRDWVEQYVSLKGEADRGNADAQAQLKRMQYRGKKEWHGLRMENVKELSKQQLRNIALKADGRFRPGSRGTGVDSNAPVIDPIAEAAIKGLGHTQARRQTSQARGYRGQTSQGRTRQQGSGRGTLQATKTQAGRRYSNSKGSSWTKLAQKTAQARSKTSTRSGTSSSGSYTRPQTTATSRSRRYGYAKSKQTRAARGSSFRRPYRESSYGTRRTSSGSSSGTRRTPRGSRRLVSR